MAVRCGEKKERGGGGDFAHLMTPLDEMGGGNGDCLMRAAESGRADERNEPGKSRALRCVRPTAAHACIEEGAHYECSPAQKITPND